VLDGIIADSDSLATGARPKDFNRNGQLTTDHGQTRFVNFVPFVVAPLPPSWWLDPQAR
jgi:hypothetical protein